VADELVKRNHALVKYEPPEHLVVDLDQDGRRLLRLDLAQLSAG
jgi:hypothetical protein